MLKQLARTQDRWGGHSSIIDNWLQERQQLLIQYCHLAGLDKAGAATLPDANDIDTFCAQLMDYLSAGHFEVFEMLVGDDTDGLALKEAQYPKLAQTTDQALAFNDKYAEAISEQQASDFDDDLAALGETLEERFALEDELISHMYHSQKKALQPSA